VRPQDNRSQRQDIAADLADLLGDTTPPRPGSTLDLPLTYTLFRDVNARVAPRQKANLREIAAALDSYKAKAKVELPLIKLALFGDVPTPKGSLRNNANLLKITGIEADYDGEEISPAVASERLRTAGVAGLIYTSPSHQPKAPRWRVLAALSTCSSPEKRGTLCSRLNGALAGC
jgi:hypothetical protein